MDLLHRVCRSALRPSTSPGEHKRNSYVMHQLISRIATSSVLAQFAPRGYGQAATHESI